MGVVISDSRVLRANRAIVTVNGATRWDFECDRISLVGGANPSVAEIRVPTWYFEDDFGWYADATVVVAVNGNVVFRGYLDVDSREENPQTSRATFRARSVLGLMDSVFVGQKLLAPVVRYPRLRADGTDTEWTLSDILQDLFSTRLMPTAWRNAVALGNLSAVRRIERDMTTPDIEFVAETYLEALRRLLALNARIGMRERYTNDKTYLDFFVVNDPNGGVTDIKMPSLTEGPEEGAYAMKAAARRDTAGVRNRVVGFGRAVEIMLTVTTDPGGVGAPMTPAWANASAYTGLATPPTDPDELAVLADPYLAVPGSESFDPKYEYHFRLFRLPDCIARHEILDSNILRDDLGRPLEQQFFRQVTVQANANREVSGKELWDTEGTISSTLYEKLPGGRILRSREGIFVLFSRPLVDILYTAHYAESYIPDFQYRRVHGGATFTIAHETKALGYDTGTRGLAGPSTIWSEGRVATFKNEHLAIQRIGTYDDELVDDDGDEFTFGCIWFDNDSEDWASMADFDGTGNPIIISNDLPFLAELCEGMRAETSPSPTDLWVSLAGQWTSMAPGRIVRVLNRGISGLRLQVHQVVFDLRTNDTMLRASNERPRTVDVQAAPTRGQVKRQQRDGEGWSGGKFMGYAPTNIGPANGAFQRELDAAKGYGDLLGMREAAANVGVTAGPERMAPDPRAPSAKSVNTALAKGNQGAVSTQGMDYSENPRFLDAPGQRGLMPGESIAPTGPNPAPLRQPGTVDPRIPPVYPTAGGERQVVDPFRGL